MKAPLTLGALCAAIASGGLAAAEPAAAPAGEVVARTRLWLRLDPRADDAIGSVSVAARGDVDAEASAWIAGWPRDEGDPVTGDVRTLFVRDTFGPAWVAIGRQWTAIGGLRLETFDGATAGIGWDPVAVRARAGLARPDEGPGFGDALLAAAEAAVTAGDVSATVGASLERATDVAPRGRWTLAADWVPSADFTARAGATADAAARALVEARIEVGARPLDYVWIRGFARRTHLDRLLGADEILSAFAVAEAENEAGGVAEWRVVEAVSVRGEGAALGPAESRWRTGVDVRPAAGAWVGGEGTLLLDHDGRTAIARAGTRWPLVATLFGTADLVVAEGDDAWTRTGRLGLGLTPWEDWTLFGAFEAERSIAWRERYAGLVLLEYALGAPTRFGGIP